MAGATSNKVLAAGIIGFLAGMLYAPKKGTETQTELKERFENMKSDMESKAQKAKSKIKDMKKDKESTLEKADRKMDEAVERLVP